MKSFVRPEIGNGVRCPLVAACAAGLLTLGLVAGVWAGTVPVGVIGGQGGATAGSSLGGAAGNGGQSGGRGAAGGIGSAGNGGAGGSSSGAAGGSGGAFGLHATANSIITGATGSAGGGGNYLRFNSGSGGGGGGNGVYADAGVTITNPASSTIAAGNGGAGGNGGYNYIGIPAPYYGGSGGGGGNGVEFAGSGTLVNQGVINGGTGGSAGATSDPSGAFISAPSGSGGGHGVVGAGITITNSGRIAAGAAGTIQQPFFTVYGTAGDAILFTGGSNTLNLLTGSTITGNIELATGTSASIAPQNNGLTLSSKVVLDAGTSLLGFNIMSAPLTVSGIISGAGSLSEAGSSANPLILTAVNTFTGGSTVNSGLLQVDGSIGNVTIAGGVLSGVGTVGNITANGGSVSPGEASTMFGTLNSNGTVNFAAGSALAIRSTDGMTCSALHATGALTVAGSLSIHFENTPKIGATCTVATGSSVSGTFVNVESEPATVTVTYNSNNVQITVNTSDDIFADGFDGGVR